MGEPLVLIDRVVKRHQLGETEILALRDVSLRIDQPELVVILGPSGSGKTTLLNIIGGLDKPTAGRVTVSGRDLMGANEAALTVYRREVVGFIFQFYNLVPTLTARENVELVGELVANPLDAGELLRLVGLEERQRHFPAALSGGEQQRVAIARALVKRPAIVLADEPTGALDYDTSIRVLRVLRDAMRTAGCALILVTHNEELARMADRVIRIASGLIVSDTPVDHPARPEDLKW